jgi:hypothetical protein
MTQTRHDFGKEYCGPDKLAGWLQIRFIRPPKEEERSLESSFYYISLEGAIRQDSGANRYEGRR